MPGAISNNGGGNFGWNSSGGSGSGGGSGPPFASNSADNGLSVDPVSNHIVLGGPLVTPALLLDNRGIDMNGKNFRMSGAGGGRYFSVEPGDQFYSLGDGPGGGNGNRLAIDDSLGITGIYKGADLYFEIDTNSRQFAMGDLFNTGNGTNFTIDDFNQSVVVLNNGSNYLILDVQGGMYQMGDIDLTGNGVRITMDDVNNFARVRNVDHTGLFLDFSVRQYDLGELGSYAFSMDAAGKRGTVVIGGSLFLELDLVNGTYQFGDLSAVGNGGKIYIDDTSSILHIGNTGDNLGLRMNGIPGFSGTVHPVTSVSVNNGIVTDVS